MINDGIIASCQCFIYNINIFVYNTFDEGTSRRGKGMDSIFRVLVFWTSIFTIMFFVGDMYNTAVLFLVQPAFFLALSYLKLSERMYMYMFGAYLTVFMIGFTWYTEFIMIPGF